MDENRVWQIAISGTFDVANYGDLLFPILAEAELAARLDAVRLRPFSYHAKAAPEWPYPVASLVDFPVAAADLDAVLIGGGYLIRFDKGVAAAYGPPVPSLHHPTGYWLSPALIALQHGIPVIWNAPGMHRNNIPAWATPLVELALTHSAYVAVRDAASRDALARFVDSSRITVLPDTAFGIGRLLDGRRPCRALAELEAQAGLRTPYIVVQATRELDPFLAYVQRHAHLLSEYRFLVLPIGPVLGDHEDLVGNLQGQVRLPLWPEPLQIAELISRAAAVVGHSYHLAVTALACGVPVFTSADLAVGKFTVLAAFDTVHPLPRDGETDPATFLERLGRTSPSAVAHAAAERLVEYWDRVAAIVRAGRLPTYPAANRFWQSLPGVLEDGAEREVELAERLHAAERQHGELTHRLHAIAQRHEDAMRREHELQRALADARTTAAVLRDSPSMRVTAPLRALMRAVKRLRRLSGPMS